MSLRTSFYQLALLTLCLLGGPQSISGDDTQPKIDPVRKVAILIGVNEYKKPGFSKLRFAENDVTEMEATLKKLGFETTLLTGGKATRDAIHKTLNEAVEPLSQKDMILVMLCGHGQQFDVVHDDGKAKNDAFFCPYDAVIGEPDKLVSLSYIIDDVLAPNVGKKLVLIDACRDEADPGRGSRGIEGKRVSLPEDTAIMFSCRKGQRSFENEELKHGLFTHCVLEGLRGGAARDGDIAWADLVAHVNRRMASSDMKTHLGTGIQTPIPAGGVTYTVLGSLAIVPVKMEGKKAGELREFAGDLNVKFCWCPSGSFVMGSPEGETNRFDSEAQVNVELTHGYWLGKTEVTQSQWYKIMWTKPWSEESNVEKGPNYPVVHVSHGLNTNGFVEKDSATEFCRKLTAREQEMGRLPSGWKYTLPTEAQWEYACRAGTKTTYSFGASPDKLGDFAWYQVNTWDIEEKYAHEVATKKPNAWGLYDLHGNVGEWCLDWNDSMLEGGRDPSGPSEGSTRVIRGGDWFSAAAFCRSAAGGGEFPSTRSRQLGFRLALSPTEE